MQFAHQCPQTNNNNNTIKTLKIWCFHLQYYLCIVVYYFMHSTINYLACMYFYNT